MATVRGGDKLSGVLKGLADKITKAKVVKVGFLEGATYPDGTSVPLVAAVQNFGSKTIPPRPFFSNMVAEKQSEWPAAVAANLKDTGYDAKLTLERMGQGITGQLRQSIQDTNDPPLAQSTIDRKGFEKPLIDTAHMFNSIDHEVE
jgi:hypothetical protein